MAEDYAYDHLGRLTKVTNCDGSAINYSYDNAGNRATLATTAATKSLTVTSPNTAVSWTLGSTQTVTWSSVNVTGNVDIQLSRDGGLTWETLAANTPNDGSQSVLVSGTATTQARIRVRATGCGQLKDDSNVNFTVAANGADVTPPVTTITAGPCGQTFSFTAITMGWTGTDNLTPVGSLQYATRLDNGDWAVPTTATSQIVSGLTDGLHTFYVRAIDQAGNVDLAPPGCSFTVNAGLGNPAPIITQMTPASGAPGTTVTIFGANLLNATGLNFGGVSASFMVTSANSIVATVPPGALTGPVTVTTANGTAASALTFTVLGTGSGAATCATASFNSPTFFTVGSGSNALVVGDFNSDGNPDIVAANGGAGSVTSLLGNGTGNFTSAGNFTVGSPTAIAAGDFNGDGKLDVVVANVTGAGFASVMLGNGDGSFGAAANFAVSSPPSGIFAGDLNGDGKIDVVASNNTANTISVLLGTGTGALGSAVNYPVGDGPVSVAAADFNSDGKLDLVVTNEFGSPDGTISLLLGTGTGSFGVATNFNLSGIRPRGMTVSDFNGDGKSDVAVANVNSSNVSILLGTGAGGFAAASTFALSGSPLGLTSGDFNGDGKVDLVTTLLSANSTAILLGTGTGAFGAPTSYVVRNSPYQSAVGDFNKDGKLDVATASSFSTVSVLLNNCVACGYALTPVSLNIAAGGGTATVGLTTTGGCAWTAASNANWLTFSAGGSGTGNGTITLSIAANTNPESRTGTITVGGQTASITQAGVCSYTLSTLSLSVGFGASSNSVSVTAPAGCAWTATSNAAWVTINSGASGTGNGAVNLNIAANSGPARAGTLTIAGQTVAVTQANGGACGTPSFGSPTGYGTNSLPRSIALGDYNNDGKVDLAVANYFSNNVSVRLGDGAGGFGAATNFSTATNPWTVISRDFNRDGKLDLAVTNASSASVSVLLGNGTGGFGAATQFNVGTTPDWVSAGDFNKDGNLDLVTTNRTSNNLSLLSGNGAGGFGAATNISLGADPFTVAVGDFNQDNKLDLAVGHYTVANNVSVLLGNGGGGFGAPSIYSAGDHPRSIITKDLNGDGKLDLAVANQGSHDVSLLLGNGTGGFGSAVSIPAGQNPVDVIAQDFNADAKLDLAVANSTAPGSISVMAGNGSGSFGAPAGHGVDNYPEGLVASDFNGDGRFDLVTANSTSNSLSVFRNACAGGATITGLAPASGVAGTSVTITGTGFNGSTQVNFNGQPSAGATFTVVNATTITATVPAGALTGPLTVTTPIGTVMSAMDFIVQPCLNPLVTLAVDDGSWESAFGFGASVATPYFVNRLTPASYPATLREVAAAINLPTGMPVEILVGNNADGDAIINGTTFQVTSATVLSSGAFSNYVVNPVTINAGDFVVGFRYTSAAGLFPASADFNAPSAARSYFSTDNGASYGTLTNSGTPVDLLLRATICLPGSGGLSIASVIPAAGRIGGGQQVQLIGAFANLSSVTIGGVSATWSYTNGTSEVTVNTPAHAVGAVNIDLTPTSGSPYTKTNAFAYLPTTFTDNVLVAGVTTARAQHIIELRNAVDSLRLVAGLGTAPWTDATLSPPSTIIKAVHITELRTNLEQVAALLGYAAGSYTDPALSGGFVIKRVHIEELRQRIRAIAG